MLIVIGGARSVPGRRDELVEAARRITGATRRDRGCRSYGRHAALDDRDTITGVEIRDSQDALYEILGHAHTQDFLAHAPDLVAEAPTITVHRVIDDQD
jgi:quinol monooxygenase YgiN